MSYPTDRSTFKLWVRDQAEEDRYSIAFVNNRTLEAIIDNVIAEYSVICPLIAIGTITINGRYAVLPDDWVDGPDINTKLLYALQRGRSPEDLDFDQSGSDAISRPDGTYRFPTGLGIGGNGYGLGTGGASLQNPIVPAIPSQEMPESSTALISNQQKNVFVLPAKNFSDGQTFSVRYACLHKIQDSPAMMTIKKGDLADVYDKIHARCIKSKISKYTQVNEVAGENRLDIGGLKDLADQDALKNKFPR